MRAVDVVVTGRVQGVFYRANARDEASRLGVSGWIRNREDGAVVAHLEGDPHAVAELVEWCRHGPPGATVESVELNEAATGGDHGFAVLG